MSIRAVTIRNFRSIAYFQQDTNDLNIFVGPNDAGKSNVLRALDLFFNGGRPNGYVLNWHEDYCSFAQRKVNRAAEIVIELKIEPPASFADPAFVRWRKVWRREGLHHEERNHENGTELPHKSKLPAFLNAMRYDYVPAIKGPEYFASLMSRLHDMLAVTVEEDIRKASKAFTASINSSTAGIGSEILARLGLSSSIELPASLRDLFAQMEFRSSSGERSFSLRQLGDGLKVRHIPIVLRWMAHQANVISAPGRPKTVTIWGFEEPENNLELNRCLDTAREFLKASDEIQTFVTTHSPAFYSVAREGDPSHVSLFLVSKSADGKTSDVAPLDQTATVALDSSLGLLDLLRPHIQEAERQVGELRATLSQLTDTTKPTMFCEGPTDQQIIREAVRLLFPAISDKLNVVGGPPRAGGHSWVKDRLVAWSHSNPGAKAVGLFDRDDEATKSLQEARKMVKTPGGRSVAVARELQPNQALTACFSKRIQVPFAVEELLSDSMWAEAERNDWLEDRPNLPSLYRFDKRDVTFDDDLRNRLPDRHQFRLATKRIASHHKKALARRVCQLQPEDKRREAVQGLAQTLRRALRDLRLASESAPPEETERPLTRGARD